MFTLSTIKTHLKAMGISRFYFKKLAENDNAKNQIYLGGSFDALQKLPFGKIEMEPGLKRPVYKAPLDFRWIDNNGTAAPAPGAQLLLYPKYPEVRLSGFLRGCSGAPSEFFREVPKSERTGVSDGRILILAPFRQTVYAYLAVPGSQLSVELQEIRYSGVFGEVETETGNIRDELIGLLHEAWLRNPHRLVRMYPDGSVRPYNSRNAAGYTLEAFFGIKPNGDPVPDDKGWELKSLRGSVATLMTPQPDGGIYAEIGNDEFVRQFGHLTGEGRMYFTGKYTALSETLGRRLFIKGFDSSGKITDAEGYVGLQQGETLLASWSFPHLISHWKSKHNQACYVRYTKTDSEKHLIAFKPEILLCEGTDAMMLLKAINNGFVYLDPACREAKARNQFRATYKMLFTLYSLSERLDVSV